jgi:hypothetical protein
MALTLNNWHISFAPMTACLLLPIPLHPACQKLQPSSLTHSGAWTPWGTWLLCISWCPTFAEVWQCPFDWLPETATKKHNKLSDCFRCCLWV